MLCAGLVWKPTLLLFLLPGLLAAEVCHAEHLFAWSGLPPGKPNPLAVPAGSQPGFSSLGALPAAQTDPLDWTGAPAWSKPETVLSVGPPYFAERAVPRFPRLWAMRQEMRCKVGTDLDNYWCWDVTADLLLGVAAASLLANTSLDQDFRDWYQDDVRSESTSDFADFWKTFGDGRIFIPAYAGLAVVGRMLDHTRSGSVVGEFGLRTSRGYLIGGPPMVFMQYSLGGSRPGESRYQSRWKPFDDANGVGGHGFIGAVPFITAAKMTECRLLKAGLYACSTLTAWSRIDDDGHYLSQACLGWWMAYLACRAVDRTERQYEHLTLLPVTTPEMVGVGAICEW